MDKNPAAQISKITDSNTQHFFRVNCALRHAVVCRWCCCAPRGDRGVLSYEIKGLRSGSGLSVAHFMQTHVFQCCFVFLARDSFLLALLRTAADQRCQLLRGSRIRRFLQTFWRSDTRLPVTRVTVYSFFFFGGRCASHTTNGLSPAFLCGKTCQHVHSKCPSLSSLIKCSIRSYQST